MAPKKSQQWNECESQPASHQPRLLCLVDLHVKWNVWCNFAVPSKNCAIPPLAPNFISLVGALYRLHSCEVVSRVERRACADNILQFNCICLVLNRCDEFLHRMNMTADVVCLSPSLRWLLRACRKFRYVTGELGVQRACRQAITFSLCLGAWRL